MVREYRLNKIGQAKLTIGVLWGIAVASFAIIVYGFGTNLFSFFSITNTIVIDLYILFDVILFLTVYYRVLKSNLDNLHILYILDIEKNKLTIINSKEIVLEFDLDKLSYFEGAKGGFGIVDKKNTIKFMPMVENFDELRKYITEICPEFKR